MEGNLFNLGIKVKDLESELLFYQSLGATILSREPRTRGDLHYQVGVLRWNNTRILLTPHPMFETTEPFPLGLAHAVWEVKDFETSCQEIVRAGAVEVLPRTVFNAPEGPRRVACFRSPNGLNFEILEILEGAG